MKNTACVIAGSLLLLVGSAQSWETEAQEIASLFVMRDTISANESDLSTHIADRQQWDLRTTSSDIIGYSLLNELRPSQPASAGFDAFLTHSLEQSDALLASLYESNASRQAVKTANFNLLPTISVYGQYSFDTSLETFGVTSTDFTNSEVGVEAQWVIYSSGANWAGVRAARFNSQAADWNYLAIERQTFLNNSSVYLEAVSAQKLVAAISRTVKRLKRIRYSTELQYQAGLTSKTDIAQIDAEIESVRSQLESARSALEEQRIAYRDLVGKAAPKRFREVNISHLLPKSKQAAVDRALNSNNTINAAHATHLAAVESTKVARGQMLPQVSLYASANRRDYEFVSSYREFDWETGVRVNIPLLDLRNNSRYHEARARSIATDYQARDTQRLIKREVETNWVNYHSLRKQHQILGKQAQAVKRSIDGLRTQVEIGLRPVDDLLREEIQLTQNEIARIRIEVSMKIAALRIALQFSDLSLADLSPGKSSSNS